MPILFDSENTIELITFDRRAIIKNPEPRLWRLTNGALTWLNRFIAAA